MDRFQQQTAAFFTRRWIECAMDRGDLQEALTMSLRLDELTVRRLREEWGMDALTATGGRA